MPNQTKRHPLKSNRANCTVLPFSCKCPQGVRPKYYPKTPDEMSRPAGEEWKTQYARRLKQRGAKRGPLTDTHAGALDERKRRGGELSSLTRHLAARNRNRRSRSRRELLRRWSARRKWRPRKSACASMYKSAGSPVAAATLSARKMADAYRCFPMLSRTTPRSRSSASSLISGGGGGSSAASPTLLRLGLGWAAAAAAAAGEEEGGGTRGKPKFVSRIRTRVQWKNRSNPQFVVCGSPVTVRL